MAATLLRAPVMDRALGPILGHRLRLWCDAMHRGVAELPVGHRAPREPAGSLEEALVKALAENAYLRGNEAGKPGRFTAARLRSEVPPPFS